MMSRRTLNARRLQSMCVWCMLVCLDSQNIVMTLHSMTSRFKSQNISLLFFFNGRRFWKKCQFCFHVSCLTHAWTKWVETWKIQDALDSQPAGILWHDMMMTRTSRSLINKREKQIIHLSETDIIISPSNSNTSDKSLLAQTLSTFVFMFFLSKRE